MSGTAELTQLIEAVATQEEKVETFLRYKLVIKITNSTVVNKLQSYSLISALGPEGHCRPTSRFKRAMCRPISCRPHVDVHKGEQWRFYIGTRVLSPQITKKGFSPPNSKGDT